MADLRRLRVQPLIKDHLCHEDKYDKYRYDDVLQQVLNSSTLKNHWNAFESKIKATKKKAKMHRKPSV